ncbi:protein TraG [Serratia plymuthica A30]|uniref:conjugal transfer mating-pair stabilization protein TraG n=1 Tax=Serratia plymuthica TaxID=82996 RepID=UPI0002A2291B|nr:conjugal transfer mating-pair stabilization protein TraG [Serratia plymuthica]EKF67008.1 protein TraG [Serratia plymuthica A30]
MWWEIYVLFGSDMWRSALNGIVTLMGTSSYSTLMRMAEFFSILATLGSFMRARSPLVFLKWAAFIFLVSSVLLAPKRTVRIIETTDQTTIYPVANVPLGIAFVAHMTTSIGIGMARLYDYTMARPDSVTYTKTGMLFGSQLIAESTDYKTQDPILSAILPLYVESCVTGDILINHKYSISELMNSNDPLGLITQKPSPLRGLFYQDAFRTCAEAANIIKTQMGIDTSTGGKTWLFYANKLASRFRGTVDPSSFFAKSMGESYAEFYSAGMSATQIMKNNVTNNAVRMGIKNFGARSNDTAGLINLSSETAYTKMRLGWSAGQTVAVRVLPLIHSLLMLILVCMFPLVMVISLLNHDTFGLQTMKTYVLSFFYFQTWPIMYSILNFAATFYAQTRAGGVPLVLSNADQVALLHSDVANIAGWMSLSIPVLAGILTKGAGAVANHGIASITSSVSSTTAQQSSTAADGNWSFGNMSTDNVSANKFDTNFVERQGQISRQTGSGATTTQTGDGSTVYDTSGAMSRLPVHVGFGRMMSSAYSEQAREAEAQAQTSLSGYNSSVASGWNQLSQFTSQKGNSDSMVAGADNSQATNTTMAMGKMQSAVKSYAKDNNISEQEAYNHLMDRSQRGTIGVGAGASLKFDTDKQVVGKVGQLATGVSGHADVHAKGDVTWGNGSSHGTQDTNSNTDSFKSANSSQAAKDFKEGMDVLTSSRVSNSGNHTDNSSNSNVDQFAATLSTSKSSYQQYSDSISRSHEYSEMASKTQSMSSQIDSNYDQQFANYVTQNSPADAQAILTDTSSPAIAAKREEMAKSFVKEYLQPQMDSNYESNRSNLGQGMQSVSGSSGSSGVVDDFSSNKERVNNHASESNIKGDVAGQVASIRGESSKSIHENQSQVAKNQQSVNSEYDSLKGDHQNASDRLRAGLNKESEIQGREQGKTLDDMKNETQQLVKGGKGKNRD